MEQKKGRRNPIFDLSDPKQKNAFDFLGIIEREQATCISILINKLMKDYNLMDLSNVTKDEIKHILKEVEHGDGEFDFQKTDRENIREMVLSILKENQKDISFAAQKEEKAHDEPSTTKEEKSIIETAQPEVTEPEVEEDDWESDTGNSLNIDLLSELASFNT